MLFKKHYIKKQIKIQDEAIMKFFVEIEDLKRELFFLEPKLAASENEVEKQECSERIQYINYTITNDIECIRICLKKKQRYLNRLTNID